jgi:GNAT superfamily N-acetyltransferase
LYLSVPLLREAHMPLARVLQTALKYYRRFGFRRLARMVASRYVYASHECVITRISLEGPPVDDRIGTIELRLAGPGDLARLEQLEPYDRRGSIIRAHVEEDRNWLFVASDRDRIVATRLVSGSVPPYGVVARAIRLGPGQLWGGEVFCVPEYRNRGIGRCLSLFGDRYLASLGYREIVGVIDAANIKSLRMHLHKGVELIYHVSYVRVLFYKRVAITQDVSTLVGAGGSG